MPVRYCIIGTGFAGTCTLWHLVQRLTDPHAPPIAPAIAIVTVERGAVNGPGYPYASDNAQLAHRCNNQASTMAIHDNDFIDWMVEHKPRLIREHPALVHETHPGIELAAWRPDNDEFYPRAMFGLYLEHRFREAVDRARAHGIQVQHYLRHEVVDGYAEGDRFAIALRNLDTDQDLALGGFDRVLLGTGHWVTEPPAALAGCAGYIAAPYPPGAVKSAVASALASRRARGEPCVFVQGMGPSGIDAILTLCDDGEFVTTRDGHIASYRPAERAGSPRLRVVAGSRCGLFSPVRGPLAGYELHHLTQERLAAIQNQHRGHLKIDPIVALLDQDLRRATAGAVGWADVARPPYRSARDKLAADLQDSYAGNLVYTILLKARRLRFYSSLEPRDKEVYDRILDTHFIRTAVPMPAANAEKLLALIDAGVLTTVTLGYDTPGPIAEPDGGFRISYRSDAGPATLHADCVVRAAAQDFAMERHPSRLLQNLLRRGEVVPHQEGGYATGGIALDPGGYRVMKRVDGVCVPSPHLASFGSPVRFWQNERNFSGAFVEAAEWVASDWVDHAAMAARLRPAAGVAASQRGGERWR